MRQGENKKKKKKEGIEGGEFQGGETSEETNQKASGLGRKKKHKKGKKVI